MPDSPDPVAIGNNLNYTIVLTNNGPLVAASPSFVDNLPAAVSFRSLSVPAGWTCITPAIGGRWIDQLFIRYADRGKRNGDICASVAGEYDSDRWYRDIKYC
jgi:uncharacterized repeat protein (TIGR01451 family)